MRITDYKYTWLYYYGGDPEINGIIVTKPYKEEHLHVETGRYRQIRAIEFEFGRSAFRKSFDTHKYLDMWLRIIPELEFLDINGGESPKSLPESVSRHKLKHLRLICNGDIDLSDYINGIESLETLEVKGDCVNLGKSLGRLKNLKSLNITADKVPNIEAIGQIQNLKNLRLGVDKLDVFPESFGNLSNLKSLEITGGSLSDIPDNIYFSKLENLEISDLPYLGKIPERLTSATDIQNVSIARVGGKAGELILPDKLNWSGLTDFSLAHCPVRVMPEMNVPSIKKIKYLAVPAPELFSKMGSLEKLESLEVSDWPECRDDISNLKASNILSYRGQVFSKGKEMDFSIWKNLQYLELNGGQSGVNINIIQNPSLEILSISNNKVECKLEHFPAGLKELNVENVPGLENIEINKVYPSLKKIEIGNLPKLKEIEWDGGNLPALNRFDLGKCINLIRIDPALMKATKLYWMKFSDCPQVYCDYVQTGRSYFSYDFKDLSNLSAEECYAFGFWLFEAWRFSEPTEGVLENTLKLFSTTHDSIFHLISKNLKYLNPGSRCFSEISPEELKGKKVSVLGKTFGAKTAIKNDLKAIGMAVTLKAEHADFIVLGKKTEWKTQPKPGAFFVDELVINEYLEKHSPKFLQETELPESHIENLRDMLHSCNPESEALALEMFKNGGLPEELEGDCLVVAKVSDDKKLRSRYKTFLKGKISEDAAKFLSMNVRFDLRYSPFWDLSRKLSTELLGKICLAFYRRNRKFWTEVLRYCDDTSTRMEIIEKYLFPELERRPHYVSFNHALRPNEIEAILQKPELKGELKRLKLYAPFGLPEAVGEHSGLKELDVSFRPDVKELPDNICSLKRLSVFRLMAPGLQSLPDNFGNMEMLRKISFFTESKIRLPESLHKLKKLECFDIKGGVENPEEWESLPISDNFN
ncbi:hypothetical protein FUAX_50390 (plasmid) [Fulvitalea axinellae]|uniref:BRCT domain-containing protein n=1 Tax=Fulvitalea axinellae TaxID=1182444 RepID=A0AAU9D5C1_9BACT|nr:hypothetical protein FUAX_50390 [Fulvitalea axinellae]